MMLQCEVRGRGWGQRAVLTVSGTRMDGDLWVLSDGTAKARRASRAHAVTAAEALEAARDAAILIIGTGCLGQVRVGGDVAPALTERGIGLLVLETPQACQAFNEARPPRAAILHCAC